jgi:hypothetical protein
MAEPTNEGLEALADAEALGRAVERYLADRYPQSDLTDLTDREGTQQHDRAMAYALLWMRRNAAWPTPTIIGEPRCIECHGIMQGGSAAEDEELCFSCAAALPQPEPEPAND